MIRCVKDLSPEMEEKYRGSPPAGRRYRFLDRSLELRSNSSALAGLADGIYGSFYSPEPGPADIVTCLLEEQEDRRTPYRTLDPGFDSFLCSDPGRAVSFWGAQLMCNHLYHRPFLFLHASVLEKSGRVFIFAGASGSGKTTFILSLGKEGFSFFSDEFAPLALSGGDIHPFPRSLLLGREHLDRPGVPGELPFFLDYQEQKPSDPAPPRRFILAPGRVFPSTGRSPAPPAAFCFLDGFSPDTTTACPLPAGRALETLLKLAVNAGYLDPAVAGLAVEMLAELLSRVPAYLLRPGPPDEDPTARARAIEDLAAGSPVGRGDLERIGRRCREILERKYQSTNFTNFHQ